MSVICDTTKIKVFYDNEMWKVLIRGLKNRNGKSVKFMLSKDANLSQEELYTLFFERLEKGEFRQKGTTGGGVLRQHDDGSYFLDYPAEAPKPVKAVKVYKKAVEPAVSPMAITSKSPVLFNTHDPAVRALVGSPVVGSTVYVFSEGDTCRGILDSVNGGFHIRLGDGTVKVCPFIKELRPEPLNLNNSDVRRSLFGKVIVAKDGTHELLISNAVKKDGMWRMNGLGAVNLMNEYTFADGSPLTASL